MTAADPALALSFFDAAHGLHVTVRSGLTIVFDGRRAEVAHAAAELGRDGDGWRALGGDGTDLRLVPTSEMAELGGVEVAVCRAEGRVAGRKVDGLGTAAETRRPPAWSELDAVRAISAVFAPDFAAIAVARRPRGVEGHGAELVTAAMLEASALRSPEETRISTVYDDGGRQHSCGLELWFPGEDYPRRLFGTVQAGTSLELEGLLVHAAAFTWRMEGHAGAGVYELTTRREDSAPAAA